MPILIENKKVRFNYEILETYNAGVEFFGFEVKSVRKHQGSLEGAHITVRGGEAYLLNAHIPPFQAANTPKDYDPYRQRRLLLTRKELDRVAGLESTKGLTVVPLSLYNSKRNIKLSFAVVRGRKKHDKREVLKKRTTEREIRREVKAG